MFKLWLGLPVRLEVDGFARKWRSEVGYIGAVSSPSDPRVADRNQYSGLNAPMFYVVDLTIANLEGLLKPGMVGTGRIYGVRRSIAGLAWQGIAEFFGRKVW